MMQNRLTEQPLIRSIIRLTLPSIGSGLFIVVFEIADMFWIGRLGASAVAALGAASFFVWMLRALAQTMATGILAMVSRRIGEGDEKRAIQVIIDGFAGTSLFSFLIMAVTLPFSHQLFQWIHLEPVLVKMAGDYVQIIIIGLISLYLTTSFEHVIRGLGNTKTPMIVVGSSLILNIVLDPVFIFIFKMGLTGAAIATVISHLVAAIWLIFSVPRFLPAIKHCRLHHSRHFFKRTVIPMVRIGAPIAFNGVAFSVIYLILSGIISYFGSKPLAALGIGHRIETVPFFVAWGFSVAVSTIVGQNLGAGKPERAKEAVFLSLKIASSILFLISVIFYFFPESLYLFFISDTEVVYHGVHYLKWIAIFETFLALEIILEGAFSGSGHTHPPMIIAIPVTFLRIPGAWLLGVYFDFGIDAIWFFISFTTFIKGVLLLFWFLKGTWMEKEV